MTRANVASDQWIFRVPARGGGLIGIENHPDGPRATCTTGPRPRTIERRGKTR